jgi:hypothetical protein
LSSPFTVNALKIFAHAARCRSSGSASYTSSAWFDSAAAKPPVASKSPMSIGRAASPSPSTPPDHVSHVRISACCSTGS